MGLLKKLASCFLQDRGREGPEYFAMFDAAVQDFLHFRAAGIRENTSLAQGTWAPFRTALKPAQNFPVGDVLRGGLDQCVLVELIDLDLVAGALELLDGAANVLRRGLRSPSCMVHHEF